MYSETKVVALHSTLLFMSSPMTPSPFTLGFSASSAEDCLDTGCCFFLALITWYCFANEETTSASDGGRISLFLDIWSDEAQWIVSTMS